MGMNMSYTRVDYELEMTQSFLTSLTPEERLRGLPPNEVLRQFPPEERLRGLPLNEILNHFDKEQIRAYLEQSQHSKN